MFGYFPDSPRVFERRLMIIFLNNSVKIMIMTNAGVKTLLKTFFCVMVFPKGTGTSFPRVILLCIGV